MLSRDKITSNFHTLRIMDYDFDLHTKAHDIEWNCLTNDSATAGILQTTAGTYTTNLPNDYGLASDIYATPHTISIGPYTPYNSEPFETTEGRIKEIVSDEIKKALDLPIKGEDLPFGKCLPFKYRLKHR